MNIIWVNIKATWSISSPLWLSFIIALKRAGATLVHMLVSEKFMNGSEISDLHLPKVMGFIYIYIYIYIHTYHIYIYIYHFPHSNCHTLGSISHFRTSQPTLSASNHPPDLWRSTAQRCATAGASMSRATASAVRSWFRLAIWSTKPCRAAQLRYAMRCDATGDR